MRQFDVYENPSAGSRAFAPYLAVLQSHHLSPLDTVIVAPLVSDAGTGLPQLELAITIGDADLYLAVQELSSIEAKSLRVKVGDVSEHEDAIRRALGRLFTGF